jgi:hypothetical protein
MRTVVPQLLTDGLSPRRMLAHRLCRHRLDAFVDGELAGRGGRAVAAHVDDCWSCSGELMWRRLIKASTKGLGDRGASDLALARLERWGGGLAR